MNRITQLDPAQATGWTYEPSTSLAWSAGLLGGTEDVFVAGQLANARRLGSQVTVYDLNEHTLLSLAVVGAP